MLQLLLVWHSRQSLGTPFLSCSVQLLQWRLLVEQAERGNSVLKLQHSAAAMEATCRAERNRSILLKLLRSIYFLAKNKIPHTTTYPNLIALQVANGDRLLEEYITQGSSNAQYT